MLELVQYGWDSEIELAELTPEHIKHVLKLYLSGIYSDVEVRNWANAIERRDDIGLLRSHAEVMDEMVFWLANPAINYAITPSLANCIIHNLDNNAIT